MEKFIWPCIMIPMSLLFTAIGIYSMKRKKPMWFNSSKPVKETEISDIKAYNKANGFMWLTFSLVFWISSFLGLKNVSAAGLVSALGCILGIPCLAVAYKKIYNKYKVD
ncbi:MAG: hypothetical protein K6F09_09375 [Clostridiales bacterium]|nr:hypothetical protein [Clostridiales bacterium]